MRYGEQRKACAIVNEAIKRGYKLSVNDGEVWTVKGSTDYSEVLDALATTDQDYLRVRDADGQKIGDIWLIWGNCPSGEELVADYTDNDTIAGIVGA